MGTFSWLTSDTEESISLRDDRPVYLLQPNGLPPICEPAYEGYGKFDGISAYVWLAHANLPKEKIKGLTDDQIFSAGLLLGTSRYYVDAVTGQKHAFFHEGADIVDPEITLHRIKYSDPAPGYDGMSANELVEAGHLIPTPYEVPFPLKFSYDPSARYEDLPAAKDCPHQGYPPRQFEMTNSRLSFVSIYYGETHPFWDVCFTPLQIAHSEVEDETITRISVMVDPNDGTISLNNGYAEGSTPYDDENSLFENFEDAIVELLVDEVPADNPAYAAFLAKAAEDADWRRDQLVDLETALAVTELDLEDAEAGRPRP